MFEACENLSFSPDLPATTLTDNCYRYMYFNCYKLARIPSKINAEIMAPNCCYQMFMNCTSILEAPELPATTLADGCYEFMFEGCTNLLTAPNLPATILATNCYRAMFKQCSSLNSVKIGYEGNFDSAYFDNWVTGVALTGTFYYNGDDTLTNFGFPEG